MSTEVESIQDVARRVLARVQLAGAVCRPCGGAGEVEFTYDVPGAGSYFETIRCTECDGSGVVLARPPTDAERLARAVLGLE